jgi:hypothetical protein
LLEPGTRVGYDDELIGLRIGVVVETREGGRHVGVHFGGRRLKSVPILRLQEVAEDTAHDRALGAAWAGIGLNDDLGHRLLSTERVAGVDVSVWARDGQLFLSAGPNGANLRRVGP